VLAKDVVYWDSGLPGFGVKVTPKGRKVFLVMYRLAGAGSRLRKYTVGPYGRVTLPMAKAQAQKIFAARLDGRDPAEEKSSHGVAWSSIASTISSRPSFENTSRRSEPTGE
jgi:Arm domain-containing DNA-binding protein